MVRRPAGYGGYKPQKMPTRRKPEFEALLSDAIARHVKALMRYEDDLHEREIAPYVLFASEDEEVCISTFQFRNPAKPNDGNEPRTFTVGKIATLRLTGEGFAIDPRFERGSKRHHRILRSV